MLEGVVNVLKPPGLTSSDVVSDIRHIFGMKRVGHTGTLDPGAAGVLPICIGRATRLFDYLVDKEKEYIGEITFGISTDTQDSYGEVTVSHFPDVNIKEIGFVLAKDFWGKGLMTEAVKAVICYCFDELNLDAVSAGHFVGNDPSRRVIEKCGFEFFADTVFHSESLNADYPTKDYIVWNKRKNIK